MWYWQMVANDDYNDSNGIAIEKDNIWKSRMKVVIWMIYYSLSLNDRFIGKLN